MINKFKLEIIVLVLVCCTFLAFNITNRLTPSQERGKLIYTQGMRSTGISIDARLSGAKFDAKILPCINCHGIRGGGNPEGGVEPSPLDWFSLTKSYAIAFKNGRKRVGYDQKSLKRAIVDGIDPSENKLDLVMPRYSLNDEDIEDLISYLKIIDKNDIDGVTDSSINVGVILPSKNKPRGRSEAVVRTIKAYLDLINSGGGLYNRKFLLTEFFADDLAEKTDSLLLNYLAENDVFAFIGSDLDALPPSSISILERENIPVVGAISGNPNKEDYLRNNFYYLFSGLDNEFFNLANYAIDSLETTVDNFVVLYDSSSPIDRIKLENILSKNKYRIVDTNSNSVDQLTLIAQLKKEGIRSCLYVGAAKESFSFLVNTQKIAWYPNILLPGKFASASWLDAPIEMNGKIYFSYPTWISERNEKAMYQYNLMASEYNLEKQYLNAQLNSLAATILFTEVLKLTDKEINRELMLKTLHGLQQFETGFISPLTFGPNKRIGSEKIFIVRVDLKNKKLLLY